MSMYFAQQRDVTYEEAKQFAEENGINSFHCFHAVLIVAFVHVFLLNCYELLVAYKCWLVNLQVDVHL